MRIRSIEKADREFFIDRCHAFYRTPACDHEIPQQNAERTFELLMHGTPYADCLIAEDDDGVDDGEAPPVLTPEAPVV